MFKAAETSDIAAPLKPKPNWPLIIGGAMALLILALAIFGPTLAPQDPREKKLVIQVNGKWLIPPYPAFTPGFPLGSDNLGRDLFSWLLWSVRPTLLLVVVVAALRMILGLLIGVGAGWSDRRAGRLFDGLITAALAVPTLLAALIVITAVGFRVGVWAFVIGLAITGWAETAQLVREQTRTIRAQDAIEAAVALGASGGQILFLHIVPQVMPMLWMLLAFEISNTLVTTAGLGFLGYYLGGAVFTEVSDFVYQRISEMPELGQMLATAWMVLDEPWAMVAAGTLVFVIVLAFNLIGEGLQQRLTRHLGGSRALYTRLAGDVLPWFDERFTQPLTALAQRRAFRPLAALLLIAALGGGALWWRAAHAPAATPTPEVVATEAPSAPGAALVTPGNHVYANEGGDPWQTRWLNVAGPLTSTVQWTFETGGFTGGPVIDAAGTLYIAAKDGTVYALDDAGNVQWQTMAMPSPVGSPALATDGTLYVADKNGLTALSAQGKLVWRFTPDDGKATTSGPVVGLDGAIYYKTLSSLWALAPDGTLRWQAAIPESAVATPPRLSPDGQIVFWESFAFNVADGSPYAWDNVFMLDEPLRQVLVGADAKLYHRYDVRLARVMPAGTAWESAMVFNGAQYNVYSGLDAGVTPDGRSWFASPIQFGLSFRWFAEDGTLDGLLKMVDARKLFLAGIDQQNTAFICSDFYDTAAQCMAFASGVSQPLWRGRLNGVKLIAGVALAEGRLYVTTADGKLLAIGAAEVPAPGTAAQTTIVEKLLTPGGHLWAAERGNPWGTLWSNTVGPQQTETAWTFEAEDGLSGGPAVAADGTLYVAVTGPGRLYALNPAGEVLWQTALITSAVGAPALDAQGNIYVVDLLGGLATFTSDGQPLWRWLPENVGRGYTGPIVAPDGVAYYGFTRSGKIIIQAVSADGSGLWEAEFSFTPNRYPPALSPAGNWLFWETFIIHTRDGAVLPDPLGDAGPASAFFTGANGVAYARIKETLAPLVETEASVTPSNLQIRWYFVRPDQRPIDYTRDSGVTPDNIGWLSGYLTRSAGVRALWGRVDGEAYSEVVGDARSRNLYRPDVVAVDRHATLYLCGDQGARCSAFSPSTDAPVWELAFENGERAVGGALAAGRLYLATTHGRLLAIGK
ncbi:MAG TPA: PQQ-binding-like beta-propeller repeat protein [Anaerolineae bacterium]|nr:PQQ-binding-like beta-propeller repeat protein [Anaerolineae bacterium]HQI83565.1 PQQ-binding-like beta-propeller repeat protein [Anaerolineae bacterium]